MPNRSFGRKSSLVSFGRKNILVSQPHHGTFIPSHPCSCKRRGYGSRADAKVVIKEMRRKSSTRTRDLVAERCAVNGQFWHVSETTDRGANLNDPPKDDDD